MPNGTTYNITAIFEPTITKYNGSNGTGVVTVTLLPLVIVGNNTTCRAGEKVTDFNITVDNNFTGDLDVRFPDEWGVGSTTAHIVNGNGSITFVVPASAEIKTYDLTFSFSGNDKFLPSSGIGKVTIKDKNNTIINITSIEAFPGESVVWNVSLTDVNGDPLTANITVTLPNGTKVPVEVINGVGNFSFTVPINAVEGTVYNFVANYAGSLDYYGSNGSGNVTVAPLYYHIVKEIISDISSGLYPGDNVTFNITVVNDNSDDSAILRNVTVRDLFDSSALSLVVNASYGDWSYSSGVWTLGHNLGPGASSSFAVTFTILKAGSFNNTANVTINEGLSSNVTSEPFNVTAKNDTVLVISNVTSHNIPGSTVVWNVSLTDVAGNKITDNVTITLPDNTTIVVPIVDGVGNFSYTIPYDVSLIGSSLAVVGSFNETRVYDGVTNRSSVTVDKFNVNIIGTYNETYAGKEVTLIITVVTDDSNGFNGVVNLRGDLGVVANNVPIVNGSGEYTFTVPVNTPVNTTYNITVTSTGTDMYLSGSNVSRVKVLDKNLTVVTVSNATLYPGESVTMNVTLEDIYGNVINDTVNVYVNGKLYENIPIVDGVGNFSFTVPINSYDNYTFKVEYLGSLEYYSSNGTGNITVAPLYYHIVKEIISDISSGLYPGDNVTFTITVVNDNTNDSAILRNVTVKDLFDSANFRLVSTSCDGWTFNGVNTWTLNDDLDCGDSASFTVTLTVLKDGNLTNNANVTINEGLNSNSTSVTVPVIARNNTIITISDAHGIPGSTVTLNVTLVDVAGNKITDNVTITLPDNTTRNVEVVDGVGNFSYTIPYDTVVGSSLNFVATFNQTRVYDGANDTAKVTVDKFNITITGVNVTVYPGEDVNEFKITVITDDPINPNRFTGDVTVSFNNTWALPSKTVHIEDGVGYINFTTPDYSPVDTTSIVNITFEGSNDYLAAEGTGNVTFKKYVATIEVTNAIVMYEGDPSNYSVSVKLNGIEGMPLDYSALHNVDIYVINETKGTVEKLGTVRLSLNGSTDVYIGNNILKGLSDGNYTLYALS